MSKIIAIVAVSPDGLIAIDGQMPWSVKEDLQRFQRLTTNHVVVMGRKTWESIGQKCLPNRENFIVSRSDQESIGDERWFCHIDYALNEAQILFPDKNIYVMGGASIYSQALPICDELELTIINEAEVNRTKGEKLYLKEYPETINSLFELHSQFKTSYATYKNYKRRAVSIRDKNRTVFP